MNILVVSVHPDDETLGAGGTLLRHRDRGDQIAWAIVTAAPPGWPNELVERKKSEVDRVAAAYGMADVVRLGLPSTRLESIPTVEIMESLRDITIKARPEVVYLVHGGDVHTDHRAVFVAAMSVLKPFYMSRYGVRRVLSFETLSSTDAAPVPFNPMFLPTVFCDVTPYMDRKVEIMRMFASEAQDPMLPRGDSAIRALARVRGATIGVDYAEAFMLVREIA